MLCYPGAFAGAVQSLVATPVDLLKIRLQVQQAVRGDRDYVGPVKMLGRVLRNEGLRGKINKSKMCSILILLWPLGNSAQ